MSGETITSEFETNNAEPKSPTQGVSAIEFASMVRDVSIVARRFKWNVPSFQSPPRNTEATRTMRRLTNGAIVAAIRLRDRKADEVAADIIEAIVRANNFNGPDASRCRRELDLASTLHPEAA